MAMTKIDTSGWKEFVVGDLFETEKTGRNVQVPTGGWIATKNLVSGFTPRITVSGVNNGIAGYYEDIDDANYRVYENFISVSFLGTVFYQANKASLDMKVHCLKPLDIELNERIASFLITVIKISLGSILYSDQISSTVLPGLKIMVPVDVSGKPDWAYMDSFMKEVMKESEACLENLRLADEKKTGVDISGWKEFSLSGLGFVNYHGQRLNKSQRIDGNIPFITAGFENRGIGQYIGNNRPVYDKSITVDMFGNSFFQPMSCAGDDNVYFFVNDDINDYEKLFISSCIHSVTSKKYAYVQQFRQPDADALTVELPVDFNGNPDWAYMDSYMGAVMQDAESSIAMLSKSLV